MSSPLRAVPKRISKRDNGAEVVIHAKGEQGGLIALCNTLNERGAVRKGTYHRRADGLVEQTLYFAVAPESSYDDPKEQPIIERPGYCYLVIGMESSRCKVGLCEDMQERLKSLRYEFHERFKRVYCFHCRDRFSKEKELHAILAQWGLHLDREFYSIPEPVEDWFISQNHED